MEGINKGRQARHGGVKSSSDQQGNQNARWREVGEKKELG